MLDKDVLHKIRKKGVYEPQNETFLVWETVRGSMRNFLGLVKTFFVSEFDESKILFETNRGRTIYLSSPNIVIIRVKNPVRSDWVGEEDKSAGLLEALFSGIDPPDPLGPTNKKDYWDNVFDGTFIFPECRQKIYVTPDKTYVIYRIPKYMGEGPPQKGCVDGIMYAELPEQDYDIFVDLMRG